MAENIIVVHFPVESEAYQALADLKLNAITNSYTTMQAGVVYKNNGALTVKDGFDTGTDSGDDTAIGGLVGAIIGIVGGPLGVLLGGSCGALIGSTFDTADKLDNVSLMEKVCETLTDGSTSLVALVSESETSSVDALFAKYSAEVTRFDAAEVAVEMEEAAELQRQMEKDARKQLHAEKKDDRKQRVEAKRAEIKEKFHKA